MAKPLYLPLALVVAASLPPAGLRSGGRRRTGGLALRVAGLALAAVPGLAWYGLARAMATVPFVRGGAYAAGPLWPGTPGQMFETVDPAQQIEVFLAQPLRLLTLPLATVRHGDTMLAQETVGILGILDIVPPHGLFVAWVVAAAALLLGEGLASGVEPPAGRGSWAGSAAILWRGLPPCWRSYDGQYLSWTRIGAEFIEGVQGRYFLPLVPLLALALPHVTVPGGRAVRWGLRLPVIATALATAVMLPVLVVRTYYLP